MSDTNLTPLERLEKWVDEGDGFRTGTLTCFGVGVKMQDHLNQDINGYGDAPTLDAAILAALAQAEGAK